MELFFVDITRLFFVDEWSIHVFNGIWCIHVFNGYFASTGIMLPGRYSDHSPAVTTLFSNIVSYPKPFKFFNFRLMHANARFNEHMDEKWHVPLPVTAQFMLAERGKQFKSHLKAFNFKEFNELSKRAKEVAET